MVQVHTPDFFILGVMLWKKIVVVHANGTHWKRAYAVMVTANIGQILDAWMTAVNVGKKLKMKIMGKEIKDECSKCGNILECELFRQGHGIKCERYNIVEMLKCQMKHKEGRMKNE